MENKRQRYKLPVDSTTSITVRRKVRDTIAIFATKHKLRMIDATEELIKIAFKALYEK